MRTKVTQLRTNTLNINVQRLKEPLGCLPSYGGLSIDPSPCPYEPMGL